MRRASAASGLVARRVPRDPVGDTPIEIDAMTRPALCDEHVASAGITHKLGGHLAGGYEAGEELLSLTDRAALVGLTMQNQGRRGDLVDVLDRARPPERLALAGAVL